jgi:hypothetical protein
MHICIHIPSTAQCRTTRSMVSVSEQLEVIPHNTAEPPAMAPHPHAPRSLALSSESKLFGPNVNMNAPEYLDELEYTPDIRGVDDGPSGM